MPRPRFTILSIMVAVAVIALAASGFVGLVCAFILCGGLVAFWLGRLDSRSARVAAALIWAPVTFLGILFGWFSLEAALGYWEVSRFIRDNDAIVAKYRADPKVHSLSLAHDADEWGALSVEIDVDDRASYERLASDLDGAFALRFEPRWNPTIRSKEGILVPGPIDGAGKALLELMAAAGGGLCVTLVLLGSRFVEVDRGNSAPPSRSPVPRRSSLPR